MIDQTKIDRRGFLLGASTALLAERGARGESAPDLKAVFTEIDKRHAESVRRIQDWIRQPTIAAENKGINEGTDLMMRMLRAGIY